MLSRIAIDPYNCILHVATTKKEATKFVKGRDTKAKAEEFSDILAGSMGIAHSFIGKRNYAHFIMYLPKKYDEVVTWHEALHMAWYILHRHSVRISVKNHEALTYLQEAIVREVKYTVYKFKA